MNWKKTLFSIGIIVIILARGWIMFNTADREVANQDYSLPKFIKVDIDIPIGSISID